MEHLSITPRFERKSTLVAFASGKGGVGKTICTANLALHLAQRQKVLAVDLDFGCGNLNASLGVRAVTNSINDFLENRVATLAAVRTDTELESLKLISCSYSPLASTSLQPEQKERLIEHLRADAADFVFMDLGVGVADDLLDLYAAADVRVLVTGPESLALHNAFLFIKALVYRIIARKLQASKLPVRVQEDVVAQLYNSGSLGISGTLERLAANDPSVAAFVQSILAGIQLNLIMNKVQEAAEERFVVNLQQLSRKYAQIDLNYLGSIPFDQNVKKSLNDVEPFALRHPASPANESFRFVSRRLHAAISRSNVPNIEVASSSRPGVVHQFGALLDDTWAATTAPSVGTGGEESEAPLPRRSSRELAELQELYEKEKLQWLRERRKLEKGLREVSSLKAELSERDEVIRKLRTDAELQAQRNEQILTGFDARVAFLGEKLREKDEILRTLRAQKTEGIRDHDQPVLQQMVRRSSSAPSSPYEGMLTILADHSRNIVTIVRMQDHSSEAALFADELAAVLGEAQWDVHSVADSAQARPVTGLKIVCDDSESSIEAARILGLALFEAGIEYTMMRSPYHDGFEVARLVVGVAPNQARRTLRHSAPSESGFRSA